jgi:hypothetical protein
LLNLAMTLHHHPQSSAQKRIWSSNSRPLFSLKHACRRHHSWCGSLRRADFVSTTVAIAYLPIEGKTIAIIVLHSLGVFISVGGGGSWRWGLHSSRRRGIGVGDGFLMRLLFFIRVAEDNALAIARRPKNVAVEVTEESSGEFLIARGLRDETLCDTSCL